MTVVIAGNGPCNGCGRPRRRYERWTWIWSQIGKLVPIAAYCRSCADARGLGKGDCTWIATTSLGADGHRHCWFGDCDRHLDFGGLTDHGVLEALGLTESKPRERLVASCRACGSCAGPA